MTIDQSQTPEGFTAIPATMLCGGCAFWKRGCRNEEALCCPSQRKDNTLVVFTKKSVEAT